MTFLSAKTWKERGHQVASVKQKANEIITNLNRKDNDARVQGMIHVRQMCNTLAAVPIMLQHKAEISANIPVIV